MLYTIYLIHNISYIIHHIYAIVCLPTYGYAYTRYLGVGGGEHAHQVIVPPTGCDGPHLCVYIHNINVHKLTTVYA